MVKKYIIGATISLVLLILLLTFSNKDMTGKMVYTLPDQEAVFEIVSNNIPASLSGECGLSKTFTFKIKNGSYIPADIYVLFAVYNQTSDGNTDYANYKIMNLREFMTNTTPFIGEPISYDHIWSIPGIAGGTLSSGSVADIYNSTNTTILEKTYKVDIGLFGLNLPSKGDYYYILNISAGTDGNFDINSAAFKIIGGSFNIASRNCAAGLKSASLSVVGGGNFYNGKSVNCSAVIDNILYLDLKNLSKINFNLEWYNGSSFFNYKTLFDGDSGVVCGNSICSTVINVSGSHLDKWRCVVEVNDGENTVTKVSNNLTMLNSPPTLIKIIPNMSFSGGFKEDFIKLSDYFVDRDGDDLSYNYNGGNKINLSINKNGEINITAPYDYNLSESFSFLISDGINNTLSNTFYIKIIKSSSSNTTSSSGCTPNWSIGAWGDCSYSNIQFRSVYDSNNCGIETNKPAENQSCTYISSEPLASNPETQLPQEIPESEKASLFSNKFFLTGLVLGSFILLILILFLLEYIKKMKEKKKLMEEEKPVEAKPEVQPVVRTPIREQTSIVNSNELNKYIKDMIDKGGDVEKIKEKLISSGWSKEQIEEAINVVRVKGFVDNMLNKGQSREAIRKLLKDKGWKDDFINKVLK